MSASFAKLRELQDKYPAWNGGGQTVQFPHGGIPFFYWYTQYLSVELSCHDLDTIEQLHCIKYRIINKQQEQD